MYVQKPIFSGGNQSLHLFERSGMDFQAPASEALDGAPKTGSVRASKARIKVCCDKHRPAIFLALSRTAAADEPLPSCLR